MAEEGYDNDLGYKVLEKVIKKFMSTVDVEMAKSKDTSPFQFSEVLREEFKMLKVASV